MSDTRQLLFHDGMCHTESDGEIRDGRWSITWRTLRGGVSDGVTVVKLSNGRMTVSVCPTRGMGVLSAECAGVGIGWTSPNAAPVHPQFVEMTSRNGLGWLEGFNELICRCGLAFNGPPGIDGGAKSPVESQLTLHGRIANIPAHMVEVGFDEHGGTLWVRGMCREATLFGPNLLLESRLTLALEAGSFAISDRVTNQASSPAELELLYHINVGPPFLGAGSRFWTSFREMSPRDARAAEDVDSYGTYLPPTPGYAEQVYFFDPLPDNDGQVTTLLTNAEATLGLSVQFDARQLPCLSLWKCTQAEPDGYVTGIEPGTNYPNFKSIEREQGRVIMLAPGASHQADLQVALHSDAAAVKEITESIADTQSTVAPTVHGDPTQPLARE